MNKFFALLVLTVLAFPPAIHGSAAVTDKQQDFQEFYDPFEDEPSAGPPPQDPLEPLNRVCFWVNDKIYTYLLQPICESLPENTGEVLSAWGKRMDRPLRLGPAELDFKLRDAGSELGRLAMSGLLGFFRGELKAESGISDDSSDRLNASGFASRFYLVLPVLGPSSLREGVEQVASLYLDPAESAGEGEGGRQDLSLAEQMDTYQSIRESSLDPYLFIRDAFFQQQEKKGEMVSFSAAM